MARRRRIPVGLIFIALAAIAVVYIVITYGIPAIPKPLYRFQ